MSEAVGEGTLGDWWQRASAVLAAAGMADPRWEARQLIETVLDLPSGACVVTPDRAVEGGACARLAQAVAARAAGQPLGRIVGQRDFWTLRLSLNDQTLEPRPDSETLVRAVLGEIVDPQQPVQILDLGCGTGCLGLALLSELPMARLIAVDRAWGACQMTWHNACANHLADRVRVVQGDWGDALGKSFDIIVTNPPYIALAEQAELDQGVRDYDPPLALYGGDDGLSAYRVLMPQLKQLLKPGGFCAIEMGAMQAEAVSLMAQKLGLLPRQLFRDYSGLPRVWILG